MNQNSKEILLGKQNIKQDFDLRKRLYEEISLHNKLNSGGVLSDVSE